MKLLALLILSFIFGSQSFRFGSRRLMPSFLLRMNIIDAEPVNDNSYDSNKNNGNPDSLKAIAQKLGLDDVQPMPPGQFEDANEERVYKMIVENYQRNPNYNPLDDKSLLQELRAPPLGKPDKLSVILVRLINKFNELDQPGGRMTREQWDEFLNSFANDEEIDQAYLQEFKDSKGFFAQVKEMLEEIDAAEKDNFSRTPELSPREFFDLLKKTAPASLENSQKFGVAFNAMDEKMIPDSWEDL